MGACDRSSPHAEIELNNYVWCQWGFDESVEAHLRLESRALAGRMTGRALAAQSDEDVPVERLTYIVVVPMMRSTSRRYAGFPNKFATASPRRRPPVWPPSCWC